MTDERTNHERLEDELIPEREKSASDEPEKKQESSKESIDYSKPGTGLTGIEQQGLEYDRARDRDIQAQGRGEISKLYDIKRES